MTLKFIVLVLVLFHKETKSVCRQSYATFCDDLQDLNTIDDYRVKAWTDLVVGDENANSSRRISTIPKFFDFARFEKLTNFIVLRQIRSLETYTFSSTSKNSKLEVLKMYGNDMERIRSKTFHNLKLRKLSLVKNNIKYIHKRAFYGCRIGSIDLSNNKLEVIERGAFTEEFLGNETKEIYFSYNELKEFESFSLPSSLEILTLDHNSIVEMPNDFLHNLINLKELTLAHNRIQRSIPSFKNLTKMTFLDASYNFIEVLEDVDFCKYPNFEIFDLSHNYIYNPSILEDLKVLEKFPPLQISLAYNYLRHLIIKSDGFKQCGVLLYGNPWNCKCWQELEKFLHENNVRRNDCDLKLFHTELVPYCAYYNHTECSSNRGSEEREDMVEAFFEKVESAESVVGCRLVPEKIRM